MELRRPPTLPEIMMLEFRRVDESLQIVEIAIVRQLYPLRPTQLPRTHEKTDSLYVSTSSYVNAVARIAFRQSMARGKADLENEDSTFSLTTAPRS